MLLSICLVLSLPQQVPGARDRGRQLFHDPSIGKNGVACADCHATVRDEPKRGDGRIRAGHTLYSVGMRKAWRGETKRSTYRTLKEAVDVCVQIFQGGVGLRGRRRTDMDHFLMSISPPSASRQRLRIRPGLEANLDYDREKYKGGDRIKGRMLFFRACHQCHPHWGRGLGPTLFGKDASEVAKKTREGTGLLRGFRDKNNWMPFFGTDRLTDREVANIGAYIEGLTHP